MSKKYYYRDPIVALYMMKEFGVEFKTKHQSQYNKEYFFRSFSQLWVDGMNCSDDSVRICSLINAKDNDITRVTDRIYVIEKSEHIFQKTTRDVCGKIGDSCQIILRDDKQFFEPEVENENN